MKHVIVIADGAGDVPVAELDGRTPFEAARTPALDELARAGEVGMAVTTPPGFVASSDVCSLSLLGYDPAKYHTGRAPIEAAAMGLRLKPTDQVFRMNLVTVGEEGTSDDGLMIDHSAGAITEAEARQLTSSIVQRWKRELPGLARDFSLTPGVAYRNILVDSHAPGRRDYSDIRTPPPHEIPRHPWRQYRPVCADPKSERGAAAMAINDLSESAARALADHPVNLARIQAGKRPANAVWIWGHGVPPTIPSFKERYGLSGAMITAVDLLAGIATLIGWERLSCKGISSFHDTDYAEQGRVTCEALDHFDVVCSHVESPDEASHQGDWKTKVAAIEAIDAHIIAPVVRRLREKYADGWRILVMPDHHTLVSTRAHGQTPPPWMISGAGIAPAGASRLTEHEAARPGAPLIDPGDHLMSRFLVRPSQGNRA